jgi:uncharacterized protein (UPF0210 family)
LKIRSITYFSDLGWPLDKAALQRAGEFISQAKGTFETAGYEVQTARLATTPFALLLGDLIRTDGVRLAQEIEGAAKGQGYDYVSIGPALPERMESYAAIPEILEAAQSVFASGVIAARSSGIFLPAVRACAEIIRSCAGISAGGFANLRFAALANVPAGSPFFPAGYHLGRMPSFALATESADLAVEALRGAADLGEAKRRLVKSIETHGTRMASLAEPLALGNEIAFGGIDFSLAPFPSAQHSIGAAMEQLGIGRVGQHGSLAAAAFLTDALESSKIRRTGFTGLLLPPLEDTVLAERVAEGVLGSNELLLYSAVCGTGLDTVPLPGDISAGELGAILLDVAALALRLDKPLTARLMPIPGKEAGDRTEFDFQYFVNSRIMPVKTEPLSGLFAGNDHLVLGMRKV